MQSQKSYLSFECHFWWQLDKKKSKKRKVLLSNWRLPSMVLLIHHLPVSTTAIFCYHQLLWPTNKLKSSAFTGICQAFRPDWDICCEENPCCGTQTIISQPNESLHPVRTRLELWSFTSGSSGLWSIHVCFCTETMPCLSLWLWSII